MADKKETKLTAEQKLELANKKIQELEAKQAEIKLNNTRQKILANYEEGERKNLVKYIIENSKDPEMVHKHLTKSILAKKAKETVEAIVEPTIPKENIKPQSYVDFNVEQPVNVKPEMTDEEWHRERFRIVIEEDGTGGWSNN